LDGSLKMSLLPVYNTSPSGKCFVVEQPNNNMPIREYINMPMKGNRILCPQIAFTLFILISFSF
jgi:hypothetical protein